MSLLSSFSVHALEVSKVKYCAMTLRSLNFICKNLIVIVYLVDILAVQQRRKVANDLNRSLAKLGMKRCMFKSVALLCCVESR